MEKITIKGFLNAELLQKMNDEEIESFIVNDCNQRCQKCVIEEDTETKKILMYYTVIDHFYAIVGNLEAELTYSHKKNAKLKNFKKNSNG